MKPTIIITAANGFLGRALVTYLSPHYRIIGLVRKAIPSTNDIEYMIWDGRTLGEWASQIDGALAIINLAGRSVDCRYNEENKKVIYQSRLESTKVIGEAIRQAKSKPRVWLNSASATIYRHSLDKPMTEATGEYGTGFSVDVCQQWEACFYANKIDSVRQVALRTAIVLGREGGVMVPFKNLVRFGLGGKMGSGQQQFSWIHIDDFCEAVKFLLEHDVCKGSYNISSPNPITNENFMAALRNQMKMPIGLPLSTWMLELGARMIQTETELILKSRYVIPEKLLHEGFAFTYPRIEKAVENLIS